MSRDATAEAILGIYINLDCLEQFKETLPAKTHLEDQYDPKTGKQLDPVVVYDSEAVEGYRIGDEFCSNDPWDFPSLGDVLAKLAGARAASVITDTDGKVAGWIIGQPLSSACGSTSYGFTAIDDRPHQQLVNLDVTLNAWRVALGAALGMPIADEWCGIFAVLSIES